MAAKDSLDINPLTQKPYVGEWLPEFRGGFSNHLPMAVHALDKLGASKELQKAFSQHYQKRLEPIADSEDLILNDWSEVNEYLGQGQHYLPLKRYFAQQIANTSSQEVLETHLPYLIPGIGAAAFHGVIRLGHGIEAENSDEIASALAYWAMDFLPLSWPSKSSLSKENFATTLSTCLTKVDWPKGRLGDFLITGDMKAVLDHPNFDQLVIQPSQEHLSLEDIESAVIDLYLATKDFAILHGVTGCYGARVILPYVQDPQQLIGYLWQALIMVWLGKGMQGADPTPHLQAAKEAPPWTEKEIAALAVQSMNDHTIKLTAACLDMHRLTRNEHYLQAARRELAMDKSLPAEKRVGEYS